MSKHRRFLITPDDGRWVSISGRLNPSFVAYLRVLAALRQKRLLASLSRHPGIPGLPTGLF
jgi:hypothetical protein